MTAIKGSVQREGEVVHLIFQRVIDLSGEFASIGERDAVLLVPHGRSDQATDGGYGPDSRELPPSGRRARDVIPSRRLCRASTLSRQTSDRFGFSARYRYLLSAGTNVVAAGSS
jgi:hypothetical protein